MNPGPARQDLVGGLAWIAFGAVIVGASWRMDRFEAMGGTLYTAPGLVPGLFGAALMLLGALLALRGWRARGQAPATAASASAGAEPPLASRRIAIVLVLTLGYALGLVGRVPFAPATALFIAVFTWVFAADAGVVAPRRRLAVALASGVLTALVVVLVFERVFLVRLP